MMYENIEKKICLSDSFESQKKTAHKIANGFLAKEITIERKEDISQSELLKAKVRRNVFAKKYSL